MGKSAKEENNKKNKKKSKERKDSSDSDETSSSDSLSSDSLSISSEEDEKDKKKKQRSSSSKNSNSDEDQEKHTSKKSKKIKKRSKSREEKKKKSKDKHKHKHKKKDHKDKDEKKHKKKHKKHKKDKQLKENEQCKYGFLTINDMQKKREEFICWLREVKKINVENITPVEERKLFEDFSEDFNTCSFPSKKYYDLMKWRIKEQKKINQGKASKGFQGEEMNTFQDEEDLKKQRRQEQDQHQRMKTGNVLYLIKNEKDNIDLVNDFNKKQENIMMMKNLYKSGNSEKALEIQKKYDPKLQQTQKKI